MSSQKITRKELINKYFEFFKSKDHKLIPSSSLVPENDPTVLFTTAGMHPLIPYLLGQKHPLGKRIVNVQKCIRTTDIEEVGDNVHHTFFEMLGNWSFGDYFKKDAIGWSYQFLTKVLKIEKEKLAVSCFTGDQDAPRDKESYETWISLGIPKERIAFLPKKDNWWGPAGKTGPCGPDTEIFYWTGKDKAPKNFNPKEKKWVEIWNDVFMQYNKTESGKYVPLKQKNVDTGMGVERTMAMLNKLSDNYLTETFLPLIKKIEDFSGKKYNSNKEIKKSMRIIADHVKASVFIISNGILPSNTERGYVLRRLIRRAFRYGKEIGIKKSLCEIAIPVFEIYEDYPGIKKNKRKILLILKEEEEKFNKTLQKGLNIFHKMIKDKKTLSEKDAFLLYQSYGFPIEITRELAKEKEIGVDIQKFNKELKKHQELSQTTSAGRFKSGLADHSTHTKRLHTATHLLNESLRQVLGTEVKQKGSNINPERLRFDFNFTRKLTNEEIKDIENLVNKKIKENLPIRQDEMSLNEALDSGAQSGFGAKYPEKVYVYTIIDFKNKKGWFSREICTGPHVKNTNEIGKFKIIKEESVAAGIRRIKAIVE